MQVNLFYFLPWMGGECWVMGDGCWVLGDDEYLCWVVNVG